MELNTIQPADGAKHYKRRVGRGIGSGLGKTAGRGHKGQKARGSVPAGFEGGQLPIMQRLPKLRGFTNPFRIEYTPVNLEALSALELSEVDIEVLVAARVVRKGALVKILGEGELARPVAVSAHAFSASAEAAIAAAGGSVTRVPLPFGHGRPPARGNALTNR